MTHKYEQRFLIDLAFRIANSFPARSAVAQELSSWAEDQDLGFDWDPEIDNFRKKGVPAPVWANLRKRLAERVASTALPKPDVLAENVTLLADHVGLNADERAIFELAVRAGRSGPVKSLCNSLVDDARIPVQDAVTQLSGLPAASVRRALAPTGRLVVSGLVQFDKPPLSGLGLFPSDRLLAALDPPSRSLADILGKLFARVGAASVDWEDFEHLGAGRDFTFRLLRGALERREKGVNILLHGAPGTGKTEFCKALAERLGAGLHAVGETDDDGDEPSRFERLQQLRLGQQLLSDQGNSLILFDEMEDLFPGLDSGVFGLSLRRSGSKVHINRLLENNPVPTLWTTNDISDCDPAFLRRISFTLELRTPPVSVRSRIWEKLAEHHRIPMPKDLCLELAHSMDDAPALADSALRAARITRGGAEDVKFAAAAISRAVRGGHTPLSAPSSVRFEPELANADHDLALITERFVACGPANTGGLCLSGPPGTGKSAFARYLAERMQMPVLERRASDLLDRYVGGSERNIADAFSEARDTSAFLVFDEADSLLGARGGATHRWEISQVNEMLTWMENHPLPFACTTNLVDQLDPATTRRFSLKIEFLPLSAEQREACFRRFFKTDPPSELWALDQLTPGDFAVVAKRSKLLGIAEPEAILTELRREQSAKPNTRNPIGFRAAS
ncbi:MAG: ATP-binding protein [Marivita sp.]|uniref:AAA family ATPase n=1 Tax=Marivita sp. TaxID=2003365 RepID=UPI001AFEED2D|nr:ATP-binding protein [Marivita sp.]MBO6885827.1 ATP-binding protein [Marivita sp.]